MKISVRIISLIAFAFFAVSASRAQNNVIVLTPTPTGSEGSTVYKDESIFEISAADGTVSYFNSSATDDWTVAPATITIAGAVGKQFKVKMGGIAVANPALGDNYGATTTQGGIDRSSTGELGVVTGGGGGIHLNEGMWFGLDATNLPSTVYIQITKVKVRYARTLTGVALNRLTTENSLIFGNGTIPALEDGQGWIDVSKLNCVVKGGVSTENLLALFNAKVSNITDSYRITGIELKIMENFDCAVIKTVPHPRLLFKGGEESKITTLIEQSADFKKIHNYILEVCDSMLSEPAYVYYIDQYGYMTDVASVVKRMMYLSYGYRMTGNVSYLNKAIADIDNVCSFPNWNAQSLNVCELAFAVGLGYDWLYPQLSSTLKSKARTAIVNFALKPQLTKSFWNVTSNWNQVCIGGLSMAAMAIYGDATADMDTQAKNVIENILVKNPNAMNTYNNGNYAEGPMYWKYGTTYEVQMLSALEGIYGTDYALLNNFINTPGFLQSAEYMQYVTGTTGLAHSYADGVEGRNIAPAAFWMAKRLNDPSVLYLEKEMMRMNRYTPLNSSDTNLPLALIYGKDVNINNLEAPASSVWEGNGLQPVFFVRTGWQGSIGKFVGIKAGTPYNSHAHMDAGSFVYDTQGLRWAMDFGKEDYTAIKDGGASSNSYDQNSIRWDIFRHTNISHNTISIKKTTETNWQHHVSSAQATIDETYNTPERKGSKVNLTSMVGLNGELNAAFRTITIENNSSLRVFDSISNGAESVNLYWNMATRATAAIVDGSTIKLTQGGKTVLLKVSSSNPAVSFTLVANRSTDPVFYDATATYERKNPGTVMVGFTATIPANALVNFTVTITDGAEVPATVVVSANQILLEIPTPLTANEGNALYYDESRFDIDAAGKAFITGDANNYAWTVYGSTNLDAAKAKHFLFRWEGMKTTNTTEGVNFGALLTKTGLDRDSKGEIGVRGGASDAIDPNEGFRFGLDLTGMPSTIKLQLNAIKFNYLTSSKQVSIVNRNNVAKRKVTSSNGFVDVRDLSIVAIGGANYPDIASFFNSGTAGNSFRLVGFKFDVLANNPSGTDNLLTNNFDNENRATVFPNIVKSNFTIKYRNVTTSDLKIRIYDTAGSLVYYNHFNNIESNDIEVNFEKMQSGVYFCNLIDNEGIITKKIIKQ
jgi:hypothetical protein